MNKIPTELIEKLRACWIMLSEKEPKIFYLLVRTKDIDEFDLVELEVNYENNKSYHQLGSISQDSLDRILRSIGIEYQIAYSIYAKNKVMWCGYWWKYPITEINAVGSSHSHTKIEAAILTAIDAINTVYGGKSNG